MTRSRAERIRALASGAMTALAAVALPLGAGYGVVRLFTPTWHSRYFPWLTGRALGIAAYLALTALVMLGVWMRHPWRLRYPLLHAETRLRLHVTLATATVALVAGHLVVLASDRYAGVGCVGAFVPFRATYRPTAVALGVIAMLLMVVVFATARTAGRPGSRHWLVYHRLAAGNYFLVWFHGVMAGTDTAALRVVYVTTGAGVAVLVVTRYALVRRRTSRPEGLAAPVSPLDLTTRDAVPS